VRTYINSVTTESEDARVHCAVLNVRPDTDHPTPPNPSHPTNGQPHEADGGTEYRPALTEETPHPATPGSIRSLRTQQRAYDRHPHTRPRSTHTPEEMRSTRSPTHEPAELVSVPPLSSTPDTTRTPENRMTVKAWAQIWTTTTNVAASAP
jgi:hypothetical protein